MKSQLRIFSRDLAKMEVSKISIQDLLQWLNDRGYLLRLKFWMYCLPN
jgi:phage antirepressor YoqD-like protein